jgi:hypothetical protein
MLICNFISLLIGQGVTFPCYVLLNNCDETGLSPGTSPISSIIIPELKVPLRRSVTFGRVGLIFRITVWPLSLDQY